MDSLISIIIPSYNRSSLISETLNSVLNQTYTNWECIIVDDGSTNNAIEIVKKFANKDSRFTIKKRPSEKPKGANACRNYGFRLSKGDYVLFLDSDDVLKDTCLEKRLNMFKTSNNIDFVIANSSYIKNGKFYNKPICEFPSNFSSEAYLKLFLSYRLPWASTMGVLWKKETIKDFKFDEKLMRLQDLDYHISILSKKEYNIKRLNQIDTYYRVDDDDKVTSNNYVTKVINSLEYFLQKHINQDYIQEKYPNSFKNFILFFLVNYLYPNYKNHKLKIHKIEKIIKNSKLFSSKELYLLKVKKRITVNGLINKKGFGINRFNKIIMKGLRHGE
ncbi:glycosyltransferase family 2 protein [Aequorivita marisscotiae]|uniref:Glycosyltransferase n=1 Tax=Aequorivita marisscotiae TaxID=3040348 RepID=A0ABY8KTH7_9FLAO|nr:glycosyltransferase family 2 protein [Aequorivita sp. Ant34-E75]WGF92744.1 glycosyltransferase [Aequorivita sp. Ant34-E75]